MVTRAPTIFGSETLSDQQLLDRVRHFVDPESIHNDRTVFEELMLRNLAFYAGKQHFVQEGVALRDPSVTKHRVLYKANKIVGIVNRAASMIADLNGTFACVPQSPSRQHRHAAKTSERLFEHTRSVVDYKTKKMLAYIWAANTGTCFLKTTFDPNTGDVDRFYLDDDRKTALGPLTVDQQLEREKQSLYEDFPRGDVRLDICNGFQSYWDWDAREEGMESCEWFSQVNYQSRTKLYNRYGDRVLSITGNTGRSQSFHYQQILAFMGTGLLGLYSGMHRRTYDREEDILRVVEYWERPTKFNGNKGRRGVIVGDTVVENKNNPYAACRVKSLHLPFVKVDWWPMPGRFTALSLTEQLTSPQFQHNKSCATMIELQNVFGHPTTFVPKGSGIPTGVFTVEPGAIVEYVPTAGKIEAGPVPSLPKEVLELSQLTERHMNQIGANADPDNSKLPSQLRSGEAIRMMLTEKNRVLAPTAIMAQKVDIECGRNFLGLQQKFYTQQRVLSYAGDDGELITEFFTSADINNDLRITSDQDLTFSKAAARGEMLDLAQGGVFGLPPEIQVDFLKGMHFNTSDEFTRRRIRGELSQEREVQRMIDGPQNYTKVGGYPVMDWEPHAQHMRVLEDFFQTVEFENLPPKVQALLHEHWTKHAEKFQLQQQQQLEMMAAAKGTPGQKGQASQPRR